MWPYPTASQSLAQPTRRVEHADSATNQNAKQQRRPDCQKVIHRARNHVNLCSIAWHRNDINARLKCSCILYLLDHGKRCCPLIDEKSSNDYEQER